MINFERNLKTAEPPYFAMEKLKVGIIGLAAWAVSSLMNS